MFYEKVDDNVFKSICMALLEGANIHDCFKQTYINSFHESCYDLYFFGMPHILNCFFVFIYTEWKG